MMPNLQTEAFSYRTFSDMLTGYRISSVLMQAHDSGLFDAIGREGSDSAELCARLGWDPEYGDRFLRCLCGLGLLRRDGGRYGATPSPPCIYAPARHSIREIPWPLNGSCMSHGNS